MGWLSLAIWLPIVSGVALLAIGRDAHTTRWMALVASLASLAVTLPVIANFDAGSAAMQFEEHFDWIERFNVHYQPYSVFNRIPQGIPE